MSINDLWIRYIFWRDMGDYTRAKYYMTRILEHQKIIDNEKTNK
jgi:hypothetical protein